ncbi:MAG: carboxypeptidase regulatory-like domain-containing protein [Candidatus Woesearchaeota archaeon]
MERGGKIEEKIFMFMVIGISILLLIGCVEDIISGEISGSRTGSITGRAIDEDGEGISEVLVKIGEKTKYTDPDGYFNVKDLEVGTYILGLYHTEYEDFSEDIEVEDGSNSLGSIELTKEAKEPYAEGQIIKSGDIETSGRWKLVSKNDDDVLPFDIYIEFEDKIENEDEIRILKNNYGGRHGYRKSNNSFHIACKVEEEISEEKRISIIFLIGNEDDFEAVILENNDENEELLEEYKELEHEDINDFTYELINNNDDVIYGETE